MDPGYMSFWASRSVLVTGGAGFVGSAVVARLRAAGCTRIVVPRSHEFDLTRAEDVRAVFAQARPDLVIHLAARVGGHRREPALPRHLLPRQRADGHLTMEEARAGGREVRRD